jgi:hypothetical protein
MCLCEYSGRCCEAPLERSYSTPNTDTSVMGMSSVIGLSTSVHPFTTTVRPPFKGDTRVFERGG